MTHEQKEMIGEQIDLLESTEYKDLENFAKSIYNIAIQQAAYNAKIDQAKWDYINEIWYHEVDKDSILELQIR